MKCCEKGRSMIEMLGVLAIVGVLSVGGIAGYSKAMRKVRSERTTTQVNELIMNIRNLYAHQTNGYKNISADLLIDINQVPLDMYDPNNRAQGLTNAYGGKILLFESKDLSGGPHAFELYVTGLDKETCVIVATLEWGYDPSSGFEAMYVGTTEPTTPLLVDIHTPTDSVPENGIFTPGTHADAIPLTIPRAMTVCSCSGHECVIGLKYL